jgi:hypothetical protein
VDFFLAEKIGGEVFNGSFTFDECLERAHFPAALFGRLIVVVEKIL